RKKLPKGQAALLEKISSMSCYVDETVKMVRRIATELRPGVLDDLGIVAAIEWQLREFQNRSGIACEFSSQVESLPLGRGQSTAVFRILQETLTNVARHAGASRVEVSLEEVEGDVVLRVSDNGRGIEESDLHDSKSLGLLGMRERAILFGGEVRISGGKGAGTTVLVRIPLVGGQEKGGTEWREGKTEAVG
ncbi:MAG: sensor histidine kinase, partial [Candidatus Binatia bacterium]